MLTRLKDFWSYKRNPYELCIFWKDMHIYLISFKNSNILKLPDKVSLENCILSCKYFNQSLPKSFKNWFTLATASHIHNTWWSNSGCLNIHSFNTKIYGRHLVNISAIYTGNYLQKLHVNVLFYKVPLTKLKGTLMQNWKSTNTFVLIWK